MHRPHILALTLLACAPGPTVIQPVPAHPHLPDTPWPMSHASPYSRGSVPHPGLPQSDAYDVDFLDRGLPSITLATAPPYPDGTQLVWGSSAVSVYKVALDDDLTVLAERPGGGGLGDLVAGAYTVLTDDGSFYATTSTSVRRFRDAVPGDPASEIELVGEVDLSDGGGSMRGLGLTWDGVLIAVGSTGRVVAVSRALEVLSEVGLGGEVSNSIAVDETGGIYVVTSEAMHRVQWTGEALSTAEADGAWRAAYEAGGDEVAGGRLGAGSGSTPSLMDVGDDRLVVITDAQPLMHLVASWRDAIPAGWVAPDGADPRVAGQVAVTFGDPARTSSISEQSVLVMGDGAVVVNNDYGDLQGLEPVLTGVAPPGIERFTWDADADTLTSTWAVGELSCPNGIPSASSVDRRMYCLGRRGETWTLEVLDWDVGTPLWHVPLGDDGRFNSSYAATEIGPDGAMITGTLRGMVRVRAE